MLTVSRPIVRKSDSSRLYAESSTLTQGVIILSLKGAKHADDASTLRGGLANQHP